MQRSCFVNSKSHYRTLELPSGQLFRFSPFFVDHQVITLAIGANGQNNWKWPQTEHHIVRLFSLLTCNDDCFWCNLNLKSTNPSHENVLWWTKKKYICANNLLQTSRPKQYRRIIMMTENCFLSSSSSSSWWRRYNLFFNGNVIIYLYFLAYTFLVRCKLSASAACAIACFFFSYY